MAFQIIEVLHSQSENVLVKVLHQGNSVTATLRGTRHHEIAAGVSLQAEISFDEILDWKVMDEFEDVRSGIWQEQDGIHLLGRIHSLLDYGDGRVILDIYVQNGPEFFTVNLDSAEDSVPDANDGLEIVVSSLFLQPRS